MAKNAVLNMIHNYGAVQGLGITEARAQWSSLWRNGGLADVPDWVTQALRQASGELPRLGTATLINWHREARQGQLADRRLLQADAPGTRALGELQQATIRANCWLSARALQQLLQAKFPGLSVSERSVARYLRHYADTQPALYGLLTRGDDWYRSNHRPRIGNASAKVTEVNQRWEMDATIADVFLADGKRPTILQVIDVHSRRMVVFVGSSSNSEEYGDLLIKALIKLGVPTELHTDNGKAEASMHIDMLCKAVGVQKFHCGVRQPQQKPFVERHFRTLNDMLFTTLPGYCGANVNDRQAIRAGARAGLGEGKRLSREDFQKSIDHWLENYYEQQHEHGGLNGLTPIAAWNASLAGGATLRHVENLEALAICASPVPASGGNRKGIRTVTAKGIRVGGHYYVARQGEHVNHQGTEVFCRWFPGGEASLLMVFDPKTEDYLWHAHCPELAGTDIRELIEASRAVARENKKAARQEQKAMQARQDLREALNPALPDKVLALGASTAPKVEPVATPQLVAYEAAAESKPKPEPRGGVTLSVVPDPALIIYDWPVQMPPLVEAYKLYSQTKKTDAPVNPPQEPELCRAAAQASEYHPQKGLIRNLLGVPMGLKESWMEPDFRKWLKAHAEAASLAAPLDSPPVLTPVSAQVG